jgi:hypothetical protein
MSYAYPQLSLCAYPETVVSFRHLEKEAAVNIKFDQIPSPSKLIMTMDKHPVGASLFLVALLICLLAAVACALIWMHLR